MWTFSPLPEVTEEQMGLFDALDEGEQLDAVDMALAEMYLTITGLVPEGSLTQGRPALVIRPEDIK